jgi:hypothetical protein
MSVIDDLKPTEKHLVMNLLDEAGVDVSAWAKGKGQRWDSEGRVQSQVLLQLVI